MKVQHTAGWAFLGGAAATLGLLGTGTLSSQVQRVAVVNEVDVRGIPTPDEIVAIPLDAAQPPYVVPEGRVLVIERVRRPAGSVDTSSCSLFDVLVDGQPIGAFVSTGEADYAPGVVVLAGSSVQVATPSQYLTFPGCQSGTRAIACGYLFNN